MFQAQVMHPSMPLLLLCNEDGSIAIARTQDFPGIVDNTKGKVSSVFDRLGFTIGDESMEYNYAYFYKEMLIFKKWLQQQNITV